MNFGYVLLGSAAAGAIGGFGAALGVQKRIWDQRFRDADTLEQGRALAPMAEPSATIRKPRSIILRYVLSILGSGFTVWLIAFAAIVWLTRKGATVSGEEIAPLEPIVGGFFFGALFGGTALLIPGVFIGVALHFLENRQRLKAGEAKLLRQYWEEREELRLRLESGEVSAQEAIRLLRGDPAERVEPEIVPGWSQVPLPAANAPISPRVLLALAAAVARNGYVGVSEGANSTAAVVIRVLSNPQAPERSTTVMTTLDVTEAEKSLDWAMDAQHAVPSDTFRQSFRELAKREAIDPADRESIKTLAAGIGAYRRAMVRGNY